MANSPQDFNVRAVSIVLLNQAKRLWGLSLICAILGPVLGLLSTLITLPPIAAPIALVALAISAEAFQWRSDALKDAGEALLRKLDMREAFGWLISPKELSDLLAQNSGLHQAITNHSSQEAYFESKESLGTVRALANLEESAWWSKHLSRELGLRCLLIVSALIIVVLSVLIASVEAVQESTAAQTVQMLHTVGNVVTAALALVFSLDLTRLGLSYYQFSSKAAPIEAEAGLLASHPSLDIQEQNILAVNLWQDYHIARATAPFVPTWFWKRRRTSLNAIWAERNCTR